MTYYSQYGQDTFLDKEVFKEMQGGVFLEMGADDGVTGSNTLFFEKERGWTGLCIEPRPSAFKKLKNNRHCALEQVAVVTEHTPTKKFLEISGELEQLSGIADSFDPRHLERIQKETAAQGASTSLIDVPSMTMNDLLEKHQLRHIDYFSLDTEGGELEILKSIDFTRYTIACISVENNYDDPDIHSFLKSRGYRKLTRIKIDDIYVLRTSPLDTYREPFLNRCDDFYLKFKKNIKKLIGYGKH